MLAFYGQLHSSLGSVSYLSDQKITDKSTSLNYYFNPSNPYLSTQVTLYSNSTTENEHRKISGVEDQTKLSTRGVNIRNHSNCLGSPWCMAWIICWIK